MLRPRIFISFDYENDKQYKYLLNAFNNNPKIEFSFDDKSSPEINSYNIPTVKGALARKINLADYTLVIIGKEANKLHKDHIAIGYRNWQNFEIAKSKEYGKQLIAIKIDRSFESPEQLLSSGAKWAYSFTVDGILEALR